MQDSQPQENALETLWEFLISKFSVGDKALELTMFQALGLLNLQVITLL